MAKYKLKYSYILLTLHLYYKLNFVSLPNQFSFYNTCKDTRS